MAQELKVWWAGGEYCRDDLKKMDPVSLRALLRERTHHTIEVPLYPTLVREQERKMENFGLQAQMVYDVWKERGFTTDGPDIKWVERYLDIAGKMRNGEKVELNEPLPVPFTDDEMKVVEKLIYQRRSIRDWIDKEVPDEMIEKILDAGRVAPCGCNLTGFRFIVIKDPEETKWVKSDISTKNSVIIVICVDKRAAMVVGHDHMVPQNEGYDAAAAADHMLLMAHALGLGGVWLTFREEGARYFKENYGLPDYIYPALHIAVGWTAMGTIKSLRMPLEDIMIRRKA
ncbi:nitroreductase family protein [Chloroflexota bacterium]